MCEQTPHCLAALGVEEVPDAAAAGEGTQSCWLAKDRNRGDATKSGCSAVKGLAVMTRVVSATEHNRVGREVVRPDVDLRERFSSSGVARCTSVLLA